jgi:2-hydroxychromene-2-carboxylate isomerase
MGIGPFGAPSFTVDGELFWGDDRLDDALRHALGVTRTADA